MKILLTGCHGQIGWELVRSLLPLGELICITRAQADFTKLHELRELIQKHRPKVIVNAAAYTAVDKAEQESGRAFLINAEAPLILAEEAKKIGALFIHYSTDYVFDGTKASPYDEDDTPHPLNVYGQSKLAGEQAIQALSTDYLILRTSWVYAARGRNFLKTILRLAAEREELSIVADQIGAPTWARLIADTTAHVLRQSMLDRQLCRFHSSIYHLTTVGSTSWHGFSSRIIDLARQYGNTDLKSRILTPILTTDYPLPAKRPANSRLSVDRLEKRFGLYMPTWEGALELCMQELMGDNPKS
ncbi:MAG: dTDP-4-dehydrorhamnose reductase [Methylococcaceae bacterium]|nr:dTDP-4-dehydrorhamnose reductase [Methylococcaceae bacterium]